MIGYRSWSGLVVVGVRVLDLHYLVNPLTLGVRRRNGPCAIDNGLTVARALQIDHLFMG